MQQRDMSITNYTLKIKELYDAFGSINVIIDDGANMPLRLGTSIRHDEIGHTCKGELSFLF